VPHRRDVVLGLVLLAVLLLSTILSKAALEWLIILGIPVLITLGILVMVGRTMQRGGGVLMAISAILSIASATYALEIYYVMARGAGATYLAYYLTFIAGVFAVLQLVTARHGRLHRD